MRSSILESDIQLNRRVDILFKCLQDEDNCGEGAGYLVISNKNGKVWLLNLNNLKVALCIYQPSSLKGRILKKCLPIFYSITGIGKLIRLVLRFKYKRLYIEKEFLQSIEKAFNVSMDRINLSFFLGTPSDHQKITIQISTGKKILGYCKATNSDVVRKLFYHEKWLLDSFKLAGVQNIPDCLYCGPVSSRNSNINLFIQSTRKTSNSLVSHVLLESHYEFLAELNRCTFVSVDYLDTDYHATLMRLRKNLFNLNYINYSEEIFFREAEKMKLNGRLMVDTISQAIDRVEKTLSQSREYSAYHGDFTPWNMFIEDDFLFVFDFEYGMESYPPMIDIFHYFTQTCILVEKLCVDDLYCKFEKYFFSTILLDHYKMPWKNLKELKIYYCCYLLSVIANYLERDKECMCQETKRYLGIWILLLQKLRV